MCGIYGGTYGAMHKQTPTPSGDGVLAWLQQRVALVLQSHQGDASGSSCVVHVDLYSAAPMALACGAEVPVGQMLATVQAETGVAVTNLRLAAYGMTTTSMGNIHLLIISFAIYWILGIHYKHKQKNGLGGGWWRLQRGHCCESCCCTCSWRRRGLIWRSRWCNCGAQPGMLWSVWRWTLGTIPTRFPW